jgi:hypothetical protein
MAVRKVAGGRPWEQSQSLYAAIGIGSHLTLPMSIPSAPDAA